MTTPEGADGSVRTGLRAALLLARGRPEGLDLVVADTPDAQMAVARHSFVAMALCLPMFLLIHVVASASLEAVALARDLCAFVLGWLGFAALSHVLAGQMGRGVLWPRFVALWNWCNLAQYLMLTVSLLPPLLGAPVFVGQTMWVVALGWALWLEWSAVRLGLGVTGVGAAMLVAADMAIGIGLTRLVGAG